MSEEKKPLQIDLIAGEASGDRHAAELLRALRGLYPEARFGGVGGRHLKAAGQHQLFDLSAHAVVGLTDVLLNYRKFRRLFNQLAEDIESRRPEVVVFVDFPGFNLRLAERLRRTLPGTRLVYYISPQVWAWKAGRAKTMARVLDHLLVIFAFEKEWFAARQPDLPVTWVGHPLLDRWSEESAPEPDDGVERIALLPGSRRKEIEAHLEVILEAARQMVLARPGLRFVLLAADAERRAQIERVLEAHGGGGLPVEIRMGYALTHLSRCRLAMVASGTATLECAVAGLPMLILYKVNPITFWVGRRLVKLPYIGMVNVLARRKIMPEFLQQNAEPGRLAAAGLALLDNPPAMEKMKRDLEEVCSGLGGPGANARAAAAIRAVLEGKKTV